MRTSGDRLSQTLCDKFSSIPLIHLHPGPKESVNSVADAVLMLPFTSRKLMNAIKRLLQTNKQPTSAETIACGPFTVNRERRVLLFQGQETPLTPKLAQLVEIFLRNPGQTLDRKTLMERIWHTDYMGDTRTLDVHIRWFRRAIESDPGNPRYLKTVRGVGYRLEIADAPAPSPTAETLLALS